MDLKPKSRHPNSVSSVPGSDPIHFVEPLAFEDDLAAAKARLKKAIAGLGNVRWIREDADYWHIECRTRLLRFRDDLELAFSPNEKVIHVRSASRLGLNDVGANRKRVEKLRALFSGLS